MLDTTLVPLNTNIEAWQKENLLLLQKPGMPYAIAVRDALTLYFSTAAVQRDLAAKQEQV